MKKRIGDVKPGIVFEMLVGIGLLKPVPFVKLREQAAINLSTFTYVPRRSLDQNEIVTTVGYVDIIEVDCNEVGYVDTLEVDWSDAPENEVAHKPRKRREKL